MPQDTDPGQSNVATLVSEGLLPEQYGVLEKFISDINALSAEEIQALIDLADKVDGFMVGGSLSADWC
jgi:hypothetical protein